MIKKEKGMEFNCKQYILTQVFVSCYTLIWFCIHGVDLSHPWILFKNGIITAREMREMYELPEHKG